MKTRRQFVHSAIAGLGGLAGAALVGRAAQSSPVPGKVTIVPRPRFLEVRSANGIELRPNVPIIWGKSLFATEYRWAARPLQQKLQDKQPSDPAVVPATEMAVPLPLSLQFCHPGHHGYVVSSPDMALPSPCILIGSPADHDSLKKLSDRLKPKLGLRPEARLDEAYLVSAGSQGLQIVADTPDGAFYGVQTVVQALGSGRMMPALDVADAPAHPFRGISFPLHDPQDIPTLQRFIREVLPRYKTNILIPWVGFHFHFRSHPEINEDTMLNDSEARELAGLCREQNVRLIPMFPILHDSSRPGRPGALLRAYPQFNETPGKQDIAGQYAWCASDPRLAPILFECIDEIITAFEADAIHLCMDEVLELGQCQFCRGKTPADLYAKVVNEFYARVVKERKLQMLMWGDRLIDGRKTPYNPMNGSRNGTHPALHMIPKDIFLCDWHYHLHNSYPSVEMFRDAGFDFVACGWRTKEAIKAFASYASKHGGTHYRGYLATSWGRFRPIAEHLLGKAPEGESAATVRNVAECYQLGMECAWTGSCGS